MTVAHISAIAGLSIFCASSAFADVEVFGNNERKAWFDAVGESNVSTIGFSGYPDNTPVIDQWSAWGVSFPGFDVTSGPDSGTFPQDGWGLQGFSDIHIVFAEPMSWIAFDFPGRLGVDLYSGDDLVGTVTTFGGSGFGFFGGITSDTPFDRAFLYSPIDSQVSLDDLHFGPPIPAPPALAPLALTFLARRSRRRRR